VDVAEARAAGTRQYGGQSPPVRSPAIQLRVVAQSEIVKRDTEMNYEDPKRRTRMTQEGLKRRARRAEIPEDYDDDDFVEGYDYQEEDAANLS
jgi:hypothetical protein